MLKLLILMMFVTTPNINNVNQSQKSKPDTEFNNFWSGFKTAVLKNDRKAVLKMTKIPFTDQYQEIYYKAYRGKKPLSCATANDFLKNYDVIFNTNVIAAIKSNHFRAWDKDKNEDQGLGQQYYKSGLYILEVTDLNKRSYNLAFGKKGGVYKLSYIPYYE